MWKWKAIHKFFSSFFGELNRVKQLEKSLQDSQSDISKKLKESKKSRVVQHTSVDESGLELNLTKKTDEESASGIEKTNIKVPKDKDAEKKSLIESAKDIEKDLNAIEVTERDEKQDPELGKSNASFKLKESEPQSSQLAKSDIKPLVSTDAAKSAEPLKDSSSKKIMVQKPIQPFPEEPEAVTLKESLKQAEVTPSPPTQTPKPDTTAIPQTKPAVLSLNPAPPTQNQTQATAAAPDHQTSAPTATTSGPSAPALRPADAEPTLTETQTIKTPVFDVAEVDDRSQHGDRADALCAEVFVEDVFAAAVEMFELGEEDGQHAGTIEQKV